jgi:hypothetical protein
MLAVLLALGGCEDQPSKLDDLPESATRTSEWQDWATIEEHALPISARNDLLQAAVAVPSRRTIDERAAALVAWMDAGGSVPAATTMAAIGLPVFELHTTQIVELVKARPDDERLFEAALYTASKLRRDGTGLMAAMMARALTSKLVALRAVPPTFATRYAPTDDEVFRLFASEAMFVRGALLEVEEREAEAAVELAMWRDFANAPTERAAFLAFIDHTVHEHPSSRVAPSLRKYAERMFGAVDAYQAWLGRQSPPAGMP